MKFDRRRLLEKGWKIGGGLLAAAAGWTSWDLLQPLKPAGATGKLKLGSPSKFEPGTATFVNAGRLWVSNADGHLFAISQKCPHLGCRVPFCESSGRFECPCHGSVFDIGGEWISGPSPRGLDQHPLTLEDGELVADLGVHIKGPDHGAAEYLSPPLGPSCSEGG
ncbi:MAG: Rieske 2Fe-2S domain-containing protein [Actinobacteria bacterium]|nr:Rieske 2Fe-2S domain-containing protein [Actinomycetota bacterium]